MEEISNETVKSKVNPLMPGANKKVKHNKTNLQLKFAGLLKYV